MLNDESKEKKILVAISKERLKRFLNRPETT